jgi:pimeloyl-ACP methyl ester carboxylesterase
MWLGIRIIAPDRPGFGLSDFQPNRQILDWPNDVVFLADHLDLGEFGVIGLSGGAPYALACAFKIPELLTSVGIVSGVGPSDLSGAEEGVSEELRRMVRLAGFVPWILTLLLKRVARQRQHNPEGAFAKLLDSLPEPDRQALSHPEISKKAMEASADSFRPGVKGHAWEMRLFGRSWGFEMGEVQIPVFLWHGTADENILPITGRMQAEAIPDCTAQFLPNEGHYSLYINHISEILQRLIR